MDTSTAYLKNGASPKSPRTWPRMSRRFVAGRVIVLCDLDVAREYGRLKQRLKEKGRPLPENDLWIAAAAKRHRMVLVTRDRHFHEVEDLMTADWAVQP